MRPEVAFTITFLLPIFFAILFNTYYREKKNANLKIVYYKIFTFIVILYLASQIHFNVPSGDKYFVPILEIGGSILMALLVFELFIIPDDATNTNDVIIIHESILWFIIILLIFTTIGHFNKITEDNTWDDIKLYRLDRVFNKIINEFSLLKKRDDFHRFFISNLFSGYIQPAVQASN